MLTKVHSDIRFGSDGEVRYQEAQYCNPESHEEFLYRASRFYSYDPVFLSEYLEIVSRDEDTGVEQVFHWENGELSGARILENYKKKDSISEELRERADSLYAQFFSRCDL